MRMKLAVLIILTLAVCSAVMAATMEKPRSIESVMTDLRSDLGIKTTDVIDVTKVSATRLEELGDAVMEANIGNNVVHEQMDAMMGGDGSASLALMHQRIGFNYVLGYPWGMMGMMGALPGNPVQGGYMMGGFNNGYGMMGGWGGVGMIFWLVILVLIVVAVVFAIRYFSGHGVNRSHPNHLGQDETAESLLKKRYARGEITKEQFDQMKRDIS